MPPTSTGFYVGPDEEPDKYRLRRQIGSGGEAELWEADVALAGGRERLAVKILRPGHHQEVEAWRDRWAQQVELLRLIQHPGVVSVHCWFEGAWMHPAGQSEVGARTLYLVMNWVDGHDLRDWGPAHFGPEHRGAVMRCLGQVADVLDWLHSGQATSSRREVIHGDVTPGNVVVNPDGQAVLVDFGLFRVARHTTAFAAGTPGYCAPEVLTRGSYGPASDRYAFGGLVYYMLTGQHPPADPAQIRAGLETIPILGEQTHIVQHLLAPFDPDPDRRPTCGELIRGLRLHSSTVIPQTGPLPPPRPGTQRAATAGTGEDAGRSVKDAGYTGTPMARLVAALPVRSRAEARFLLVGAALLLAVVVITAASLITGDSDSAASGKGASASDGPTADAPSTTESTSSPSPTSSPTSVPSPSRTGGPLSLLEPQPLETGYGGGFESGPQRVDTRDYPTTLYATLECAEHSATWQLDRRYRTFEASVGLTWDAPTDAEVVYSVIVDRKVRAEGTVVAGETKKVRVDLSGGFRMQLKFDGATGCSFVEEATAVWIDPVIS
ncbi:hypothetical protein GCM10027168_26270 [Streptomyces capparidis]